MSSTWIRIILMVIGIAAALAGMKQQKQGAAWGQPLAIVGALLAIACALWSSIRTVTGGANSEASARELRYQDLQHSFLGKYIRDNASPKKVGVIVDSYYLYDSFGEKLPVPNENKQLEGLKRGLGSDVVVTSIVPKKIDKSKLPKDAEGNILDPGMMMDPMNSSLNGKNVKACLADLKDCDVIVVMAAMDSRFPLFQMLKLPEMKGKKLASNSSGDWRALGAAFKESGMLAVSCSKASAIYDESIPRKDQDAYDRRYILITKDNYTTAIPAAQKK